jgi:hypothetical protein
MYSQTCWNLERLTLNAGGEPALPAKLVPSRELLMYPPRRAALDVTHQLRRRQRRRDRDEHVNVVRRAVDEVRFAATFPDDARHVGEQPRSEVFIQIRPPIFRRKDDVNQQIGKAVRHGCIALPGLSLVGRVTSLSHFWGQVQTLTETKRDGAYYSTGILGPSGLLR